VPRSSTNNRPLTPSEQLRVLTRVWGSKRDGYVFLPWISGTATTKDQRRKNYHEGKAYEWPTERAHILAHLQEHLSDDLYFCPSLFNGKRRVEELADAERTLWADLDAIDPRKLGDLRPTIAWESSPARYQGIWLLDRMRHGASWPGKENQRLTYAIGADPSGWDTTQLLRVPGRPNHKPEYREANAGNAVAGRLLWSNGPAYTWEDFDDLPEIGSVDQSDMDLMDEELLSGIDRHALWGKVRLRVSHNVRRYMSIRHEHQIGDADRSDVLWEIERELADAGCTLAEIVALIRPTVWNKYVGRNDELKRLKTEAAKAIAAITDSPSGGAVEIVEAVKPKSVTWIADVAAAGVKRPKWLINNIWAEGGCGFIAGAPKSYKSYFAIDMALSLALGVRFLNDPAFGVRGGPRKVLYLQEEDSQSLVMNRAEQIIDGKFPTAHWYGYLTAEGDTATWHPPTHQLPLALHVKSGFVASDESWQSWLDEMLGEHKFSAVFVDTLSTTAGSVDTDKANELMPRILKPMRELATKHNTAFIFVHHNRKDSGGKLNGNILDHLSDRAGRDMLGSTQLHAWVDCALYVRTKVDLKRVIGLVLPDGGGVAGVELYVEREAKLAEETRFRVSVPRMSHDASGVDHWMPQLNKGWHKPDDESSTPVDKPKTNGKQPDHEFLLHKLKEYGMTATRGLTHQGITDRTDQPGRVANGLKQLESMDIITQRGEYWYLTTIDNNQ
jgi:hypothetical protein